MRAILMVIIFVVNFIYADTSDDISGEFAECASFFGVLALSMDHKASSSTEREIANEVKEISKKMWSLYDLLYKYAVLSASKTRTIDMSKKVTDARVSLYVKGMAKETDSDFSNISILLDKYGDRCQQLRITAEEIEASNKKQ